MDVMVSGGGLRALPCQDRPGAVEQGPALWLGHADQRHPGRYRRDGRQAYLVAAQPLDHAEATP